ncbi:hypothetical protein GS447_09645 [Rhodococcus hoagii]|nr:hypothetical protein [Prescottella equi]
MSIRRRMVTPRLAGRCDLTDGPLRHRFGFDAEGLHLVAQQPFSRGELSPLSAKLRDLAGNGRGASAVHLDTGGQPSVLGLRQGDVDGGELLGQELALQLDPDEFVTDLRPFGLG